MAVLAKLEGETEHSKLLRAQGMGEQLRILQWLPTEVDRKIDEIEKEDKKEQERLKREKEMHRYAKPTY